MFRRRRSAETTTDHRTPSGWHQEDWESYDHVAEAYARTSARRSEPVARDLVELAAPPEGARVLDVGTGTGVAARAAREAVGPAGVVVGIDPAPRMLALARHGDAAARYVVGEALDLPFRDATFHAVMGAFVVSHFNRLETGLHDMVRVLRPGGRFAMANWGAGEDEFGRVWREVAQSLIGPDLFRDAGSRAAPWQRRLADADGIKEVLWDHGLRSVHVERRRYRYELRIDEYLEGVETRMLSRSLRRIMGEAIWERFRERVRAEFAERFTDPIGDTRDVWFGVASKP